MSRAKIFANFLKKTPISYVYLLKTYISESMYQRICVCCGGSMTRKRHTSSHNPNVCVSCSSLVDETDFNSQEPAQQVVISLSSAGNMTGKSAEYVKSSVEEFADSWHN